MHNPTFKTKFSCFNKASIEWIGEVIISDLSILVGIGLVLVRVVLTLATIISDLLLIMYKSRCWPPTNWLAFFMVPNFR